jgi:hypothetical protein
MRCSGALNLHYAKFIASKRGEPHMKDNVICLNDRPRKPLGPPHLRVAEVVFLKPASRNEQARQETDDTPLRAPVANAGAPLASPRFPWDDYE